VKSIQEQISDYKAHSPDYDPESGELLIAEVSVPQRGLFDDKDASWWESWRKQLMSDYISGKQLKRAGKVKKKKSGLSRLQNASEGALEEDQPLGVGQIKLNQRTLVEDMRVIIKVPFPSHVKL
jgi:SWI/SNF-related matrix-associated actin-dependent regulator of chromatin subfamily B protein 1